MPGFTTDFMPMINEAVTTLYEGWSREDRRGMKLVQISSLTLADFIDLTMEVLHTGWVQIFAFAAVVDAGWLTQSGRGFYEY